MQAKLIILAAALILSACAEPTQDGAKASQSSAEEIDRETAARMITSSEAWKPTFRWVSFDGEPKFVPQPCATTLAFRAPFYEYLKEKGFLVSRDTIVDGRTGCWFEPSASAAALPTDTLAKSDVIVIKDSVGVIKGFTLRLGEKRLAEIRGIRLEGEDTRVVEFLWDVAPLSIPDSIVNQGLLQFGMDSWVGSKNRGEAIFRKYDDGWRLNRLRH